MTSYKWLFISDPSDKTLILVACQDSPNITITHTVAPAEELFPRMIFHKDKAHRIETVIDTDWNSITNVTYRERGAHNDMLNHNPCGEIEGVTALGDNGRRPILFVQPIQIPSYIRRIRIADESQENAALDA